MASASTSPRTHFLRKHPMACFDFKFPTVQDRVRSSVWWVHDVRTTTIEYKAGTGDGCDTSRYGYSIPNERSLAIKLSFVS